MSWAKLLYWWPLLGGTGPAVYVLCDSCDIQLFLHKKLERVDATAALCLSIACDPTGLAMLGLMVWQTEIDALDQS